MKNEKIARKLERIEKELRDLRDEVRCQPLQIIPMPYPQPYPVMPPYQPWVRPWSPYIGDTWCGQTTAGNQITNGTTLIT
jgi:hypothetical protein